MTKQENIIEGEQVISLLREQIETIRINLDIIEGLKQSGRIKETDKKYIDITGLHKKSRDSIDDFVFLDLSGLLLTGSESVQGSLRKIYLDWAAGLYLLLVHLDRIIKEFIQEIIHTDENGKKTIQEPEIRDKRFWSFLNTVEGKAHPFGSFEESGEPDLSDQAPDPEKGKTE
jgi:hypothetical protein